MEIRGNSLGEPLGTLRYPLNTLLIKNSKRCYNRNQKNLLKGRGLEVNSRVLLTTASHLLLSQYYFEQSTIKHRYSSAAATKFIEENGTFCILVVGENALVQRLFSRMELSWRTFHPPFASLPGPVIVPWRRRGRGQIVAHRVALHLKQQRSLN